MTKETKKTTKKNPLMEEEVEQTETVEVEDENPTETVEEVVATPAPKKEVAKVSVEQESRSDVQNTEKKLAKERTVTFMAPLEQGEKAGATINVFINGHKTVVKKGAMIEVPESVANILAEHFNVQLNAGAEFLVDSNDRRADALN